MCALSTTVTPASVLGQFLQRIRIVGDADDFKMALLVKRPSSSLLPLLNYVE